MKSVTQWKQRKKKGPISSPMPNLSHHLCQTRGGTIATKWQTHERVHNPSWRSICAVEQREFVHDDFQPLVVENTSSSRKKTLVRTLPPASWQMRAATVQRNPLRPRIPATKQAERWWPKLSRRWPHMHERAVKGSGRRNLRSSRMRKGCGSIRHERSVGNTVKGIDARGPACDLIKVASLFELCLHDAGHGCLPPLPWLVGFVLVNDVGSLDLSRSQLHPVWGHKTCFFQMLSARVNGWMLREPLLASSAKLLQPPPDVARQSS